MNYLIRRWIRVVSFNFESVYHREMGPRNALDGSQGRYGSCRKQKNGRTDRHLRDVDN